jgi:alkanesulfonate monooxygenase SsuD/methylene tetrahydromethanopterin reductase-like flavin-dependent oxidoreductase (luciferase family)
MSNHLDDDVDSNMEIGIFQLLPAPEALADREVIAQALWEVDHAEAGGFGSVWIAEHHLSSFGLVGAPSVYAAAVAQRTRGVLIGYAVAVLPLHHPLRLAEEIAWVDNLSHGRLLVGVGPGFSPYELGAFGVPLDERHARLQEGLAILRAALSQETFHHTGRFWTIPPVTLRPRPFRGAAPPFLRAVSSIESLRQAAADGTPLMLGLKPMAELAAWVAAYRARRSELGLPAAAIDREVARWRVLRRVCLGPSDEEALAAARRALRWEADTARRVHGGGDAGAASAGAGARLADGSEVAAGAGTAARFADGSHATAAPGTGSAHGVSELPEVAGGCVGTPRAVLRELLALRELGIRHVIAWLNFGDLPYARVRRSMELLSREVIPALTAGAPDLSAGTREPAGAAPAKLARARRGRSRPASGTRTAPWPPAARCAAARGSW